LGGLHCRSSIGSDVIFESGFEPFSEPSDKSPTLVNRAGLVSENHIAVPSVSRNHCAMAALPRVRKKGAEMFMTRILALAVLLVFGGSQLALAQASNPYAGGAGEGTESGHPEKAQNHNRGPGKNPGGPGQGYH
jgi:hypothetical protein